MVFNQKVMYLGMENRLKKDGTTYTQLKVLDKNTKEDITLFVNHPEKFREYKEYTDYSFNFDLKRIYDKELKTYLWKLYLVEE